MARRNSPLTTVLKKILAEPLAQHSDRLLLERYAETGDEIAFGEIVSRHGPMLLGYCRRQVGDEHLAEDVLQATFLVLARKACSIRKRQSVSAWLHGVARRVARQARLAETVRSRQEERAARQRAQAAPDEGGWDELLRVLDEELWRLPERLRASLLLCFLEGRTQEEAAKQLGWALSTVRRRLQSGRELLKSRMTNRGTTLGAGLFAGVLAPSMGRVALTMKLREAVLATALEQEGAAVSATILVLAKGGMGMGIFTKICLWATAAVVMGAAVAGAAWRWGPSMVPTGALPRPPLPVFGTVQEPSVQQAKKLEAKTKLFNDPLPKGAVARLGTLAFRHGPVDTGGSLVFTSDGKSLVSVGGGWLRRWDIATGQAMLNLGDGNPQGSGNQVLMNLAVTNDGKRGIIYQTIGDRRWTGAEYDLDNGKVQTTKALEFPSEIRNATGTPFIKYLAYRTPLHFGPDAKKCAALTQDGKEIYVWDRASGSLLFKIKPEDGRYTALDFAPDGKTLFIGDDVHTIHLFDLASGKDRSTFGLPNVRGIGTMAISADGKRLATVSPGDAFVRLWDTENGAEIRTLEFPESGTVATLMFTPDGQTLLAGLDNDQSANPVALRPRPGLPKAVRAWDTASGKLRWAWADDPGMGLTLGVSADSKRLASMNSSGVIRFWDAATGMELRSAEGSPSALRDICFQPDGKAVLTLDYDGAIRTWDLGSGKWSVPPLARVKTSAHFTRAGMILVNEVNDRGIHTEDSVKLFDPAKRSAILECAGSSGVVSGNGALLATSSKTGRVHLFDIATGKEIRSWQPPGEGETGTQPANYGVVLGFSTNGDSLVVGGDVISVWNTATGKEKTSWSVARNKTVQMIVGAPAPASISKKGGGKGGGGFNPGIPPGAGKDGKSGRAVLRNSAVLSPDANTIALVVHMPLPLQPESGLRRVIILETTTGKFLHQIDVTQEGKAFPHLVFSADGKLLAMRQQNSIQVWEVGAEKIGWKFEGHRGGITSVAFSPDGKRLASASADTTVLVWDLAK